MFNVADQDNDPKRKKMTRTVVVAVVVKIIGSNHISSLLLCPFFHDDFSIIQLTIASISSSGGAGLSGIITSEILNASFLAGAIFTGSLTSGVTGGIVSLGNGTAAGIGCLASSAPFYVRIKIATHSLKQQRRTLNVNES